MFVQGGPRQHYVGVYRLGCWRGHEMRAYLHTRDLVYFESGGWFSRLFVVIAPLFDLLELSRVMGLRPVSATRKTFAKKEMIDD